MPVNCEGANIDGCADDKNLKSGTNMELDTSKTKGRIKPQKAANGLADDADVVVIGEKTSGKEDTMDLSSDQEIFGWVVLDGIRVPFLMRDTIRFCAVRMVEMKLLSKYPSTYPDELKHRPPLMSHYITKREADLLNKINKDFCGNEYGDHLFTTQDLIVKLADFREFLGIVKRHFPDNILDSLAKVNPPIQVECDGGWIQINNTVMPYVIRNSKVQKFVPLSVVRYAAGLLTDVQVESEIATEVECEYLNKTCDDNGLTFRFTKASRLIQLELVFKLASSLILFIKDLPRKNPLDKAVYCVSNEEQTRAAVQMQIKPNPNPTSPTGPQFAPRVPPPPYPGNPNGLIMIKPPDQQINQPIFSQNGGTFVIMEDQFIKHPVLGREGPPNVTVKKSPNGNSMVFQGTQPTSPLSIPSPTNQTQQQQQLVVCNSSSNNSDLNALKQISEMKSPITKKINNGPIHAALRPDDAAALGQWQRHTEDVQMGLKGSQGMVSPQGRLNMTTKPAENQIRPQFGVQAVLPVPIKIQAIPFHGRAVSCLIKDKKAFALLEALCSLYFKHISVQQFQEILENKVCVNTVQLQEEEEKAFIEFYNLPTTALKCNRVVNLYELGPKFQLLTDLLNQSHPEITNKRQNYVAVNNQLKKRKRSPSDSLHIGSKWAKKGLEAAVARLKQSGTSRGNSPQSVESLSDDQLSPKHCVETNNNVIEKT